MQKSIFSNAVAFLILGASIYGPSAFAQTQTRSHKQWKMPQPGPGYRLHPPGPPAASGYYHYRAGSPQHVAWWAIPSDNGNYVGYRIGGGASSRRRANPPALQDGTWGWDFRGWLFKRRVNLGWWHGRRYQGGTGAYRTDGPSLNHGAGTIIRKR